MIKQEITEKEPNFYKYFLPHYIGLEEQQGLQLPFWSNVFQGRNIPHNNNALEGLNFQFKTYYMGSTRVTLGEFLNLLLEMIVDNSKRSLMPHYAFTLDYSIELKLWLLSKYYRI